MEATYKIVRMYRNDGQPSRVHMRGLSLEEAQHHCRNPESSSSTCTGDHPKLHTKTYGEWFDGYEKEGK